MPDAETRTHCNEYRPVSGDAPLHDTSIGRHATGSATVTVGAVATAAIVVVVVVDVVVPGPPVDPSPAELELRKVRHTLSPTNSGVVSDAELIRNNLDWGTLKRAARRVHESFGSTRCVAEHCGESFTLNEREAAALPALDAVVPTALDVATPAPSEELTTNIAAIVATRPTRRLDIFLRYAVCKK